jgi:hypothetical protein
VVSVNELRESVMSWARSWISWALCEVVVGTVGGGMRLSGVADVGVERELSSGRYFGREAVASRST